MADIDWLPIGDPSVGAVQLLDHDRIGNYCIVNMLEPVCEIEINLSIHSWVGASVEDVEANIEVIFCEGDLVAGVESEV